MPKVRNPLTTTVLGTHHVETRIEYRRRWTVKWTDECDTDRLRIEQEDPPSHAQWPQGFPRQQRYDRQDSKAGMDVAKG
jgi:hypothetical protein